MKKIIYLTLFLLSASCCFSQTRIQKSSFPCSDTYVNAMQSYFILSDSYKIHSKMHKKLVKAGFKFGFSGINMYLGDHSQDSKLCTTDKLQILEIINSVVLDKATIIVTSDSLMLDDKISSFDNSRIILTN